MLDDPTTAKGTTPFNKNVSTLVNMIYGAAGGIDEQINNLTESVRETPITAKMIRANTYRKSAGQSVVVRLGGLDWIVSYVSLDTSGNLIVTLWLDNNHQEAWGWNGNAEPSDVSSGWNKSVGKLYGFANGGFFSDWSADWHTEASPVDYPCTMYGTSYVRTEALNNPNNRYYAAVGGGSTVAAADQIKTLSGPSVCSVYGV